MRRLLVWLSWRSHRATPKITPPASCTEERKKGGFNHGLSCVFFFFFLLFALTLVKSQPSSNMIWYTCEMPAWILKQTCSLRQKERVSCHRGRCKAWDQTNLKTLLDLTDPPWGTELSAVVYETGHPGDLRHSPCPCTKPDQELCFPTLSALY